MGSSTKKHKSEKKKKRSRSPERAKEKHRHHKRHHKDRKRKLEVIETEDLVSSSSDSDVEEVCIPPPPKISKKVGSSSPPPTSKSTKEHAPPASASTDPSTAGDGKAHDSLSIEETNRLRAKLGLKPLQLDTPAPSSENDGKFKNENTEGGTDMGEFVHKPATNIADQKKGEKIRQRITERKERRVIEKKLSAVKPLGEESDSDEDAKAWVVKSRLKEMERKKAEERAKLLEELDQEFGIGDLVEEEIRKDKREAYTAKDLRGLKVEHSLEGFEEGSAVILTLKDKEILDEKDGDVLVNVNMLDNERYKKNVELRKKKPGYDAYEEVDDPDARRDVLEKYNEEIEGAKVESFSIGEEADQLKKIKQKLAAKNKLMEKKAIVNLNTSALRVATDYYTEEELHAKFKKPGKKVKKLRKKPKMLKADDLLPREEITWPTEDLGSRKSRAAASSSSSEVVPMDIVKPEPLEDVMDVDDLPPPVEDLTGVKIEPDESELELQLALNKARKLKMKENNESSVEKIAKEIVENSSGYKIEGPGGTIVLNSTAEFCRTLGDIPTYGLSGNREDEEQELLDFERELKEEKKRFEEEKRNVGAWNQVEIDERSVEIIPTEVPILDIEPDVGSGVAGALRLALSKGYLEKETDNRPSASRFAHLQAQNYSIEDKAHGDDEKYGRRDRYVGPTMDFKEKDCYKPNVKLEYIDDDGHILNAKEAFRYLSHKFHGKGPGKNKVEKRMKKNEQEGLMKQMSSTDTPLRTLSMLQQKQKETQSAFVVLSGNKQLHSTSISKTKH